MSTVSQLINNTHNKKNLTPKAKDSLHHPDSKKWNFRGLQSTHHHSKRKSALGQTLQPLLYNPEMDSQDKKRSKSQLKLADRFNITTTIIKDLDIGLPKIKPNRKDPKRGPYLQNWLDEALSSELKQPQDNKPVIKGTMRNIKGFQLDRIFLQSQNIPYETVDKLYKSLFIYSHGIDKVFEELISSLKINKDIQQATNSPEQRLLNSFWKAFSRLLENCTSYQTAYQLVEKRHLGSIKGLKQKIIKIQQKNQQQQAIYVSRINSLEKQLEQFMHKYGKLETQYKILQSTYNLTDQTFNEQVSLRLKFQQKINSVYTSYNELKCKYQALVDKLQITNHLTMQQKNKEDVLSKQIERLAAIVDGLQINLSNQKFKVTELAKQLSVKSQEFEDLRMDAVVRQQKQTQGEDIMTQLIQKNKMFQTKVQAANQKHEADKRIIFQQKQFIQVINLKLSNVREINDRLYQRVAENNQLISNLQHEINQKNHKIANLELELSKIAIDLAEKQSSIVQKCQKIESHQTKIDILSKRIENQESMIQSNNRLIEDLKAVKDKYQRINTLLLKQKNQIQEMYNENLQKVLSLQEEKEGFKLLVTAKDSRIKQLQSNIQREKEVCSAKIAAINATLTKKQASILNFSKLSDQNGSTVEEKNYFIQKLQIQISGLKNEALKKDLQLQQFKAKHSSIQTEFNQTSKQYRTLLQKYEVLVQKSDQLSSDLSSKNYILDMKKDQKDTQLTSLMKLLEEYKIKVFQRAQHVHPMLYEDLLFRVIRQQQKMKKAINLKQDFEKQNKNFMNIKQGYLDRIKTLEEVNASYKEQLSLQRQKNDRLSLDAQKQMLQQRKLIEDKCRLLQQKLEKSNEKICQLQKQKADIEQKIKQNKVANSQLRESGQKYRKQIEQLRKELKTIKNIKVQKVDQEIQTQVDNKNKELSVSASNYNMKKQSSEKEVQTDQIEQQKQQSPSNQIPDNMDTIGPKNIDTIELKKPEKKIETKQVRRALKLTYMRR